MTPPVYLNEVDYIQSYTELVDQLAAIRAVRAALLAQLLVLATGKPVKEYFLSDQHTTIRRAYNTPVEIYKARDLLLLEENRIRRLLTGSNVARAVGVQNLIGRKRFWS